MGTLGAGISSILARKRDHLNQCLKSHNLIQEHWGKKQSIKMESKLKTLRDLIVV